MISENHFIIEVPLIAIILLLRFGKTGFERYYVRKCKLNKYDKKKGQNQKNDSTQEMIGYIEESYFLGDFFLLNPATLIKPTPKRSIVAGSGVVLAVPVIAIATTLITNPANKIFFIFSPLVQEIKIKRGIFSFQIIVLFVLYGLNVSK